MRVSLVKPGAYLSESYERNYIGISTLALIANTSLVTYYAATGHYIPAIFGGIGEVLGATGMWLKGKELISLEKQIKDNPLPMQKPETM